MWQTESLTNHLPSVFPHGTLLYKQLSTRRICETNPIVLGNVSSLLQLYALSFELRWTLNDQGTLWTQDPPLKSLCYSCFTFLFRAQVVFNLPHKASGLCLLRLTLSNEDKLMPFDSRKQTNKTSGASCDPAERTSHSTGSGVPGDLPHLRGCAAHFLPGSRSHVFIRCPPR